MREVRFFFGGVLSYSADDNFILDTFYLIAISVIRVVEATTFPKSRADTALRPRSCHLWEHSGRLRRCCDNATGCLENARHA